MVNVNYAANDGNDDGGRLIVITDGDKAATLTIGFEDRANLALLGVEAAHNLGVCLIAGTQSGPCTWLEYEVNDDSSGNRVDLTVTDGEAELSILANGREQDGLTYVLNSQQAVGIASQLIAWAAVHGWDWEK